MKRFQEIRELGIEGFYTAIRSGEYLLPEFLKEMIEEAKQLDLRFRCFTEFLEIESFISAEKLQKELDQGNDRGLLHGLPIAIKDIFDMKNTRAGRGAVVESHSISYADAVVVERLKKAGCIIFGKLKMSEGAYSSHHPSIHPPINPWNPKIWTGISSSGSGVATALGATFGSLGTDTGGSIRYPSALNGVVGLKPTRGKVSCEGVWGLAPSLDHVGPMARTVKDVGYLYAALVGAPVKLQESHEKSEIRVGIDWDYCESDVDEEVRSSFTESTQLLGDLAIQTLSVKMPSWEALVRSWKPVVAYEASRLSGREIYTGPVYQELIRYAESVTDSEYRRFIIEADDFRKQIDTLFQSVDLLFCPTVTASDPPAGWTDNRILNPSSDGILRQKFTVPYDFSGHPCLCLPCGFSKKGTPLSVQFIGPWNQEAGLLHIGRKFESRANLPIILPQKLSTTDQ